MKNLFLFTFISILALSPKAFSEGPKADTFKLGAVVGNVGLTGDPGEDSNNSSKNAIGVGGVFGYSIEDELSFELMYMQSSHDKLDHKDFNLGVQYYVNSYEPFYYGITGGVAFVTNEVGTIDDTAFGLFIGAGADVFTKRALIIGLQARYYSMFGSEVNGVEIVDDYYTVLARILFQF
ncbi:MAG: outer membrane beta-barrel protein [Bdellovibrionota bacterium]